MSDLVRIGALAGLLLLMPPFAAQVSANPDSAASPSAYEACLEESGGITAYMRECSATEYARLDALLNANYQMLMKLLPAERREIYRKAQRAWLTYRDAQ